MERRIELDGLTVTVEDRGEEKQPWAGDTDTLAYRYDVIVDGDGSGMVYCTEAWGSQADYARGHRDYDGIAYMVLGEMLSAAYDPDEFWEMAAPKSRRDAQRVATLCDSATMFLHLLERNQDAIEAHS